MNVVYMYDGEVLKWIWDFESDLVTDGKPV